MILTDKDYLIMRLFNIGSADINVFVSLEKDLEEFSDETLKELISNLYDNFKFTDLQFEMLYSINISIKKKFINYILSLKNTFLSEMLDEIIDYDDLFSSTGIDANYSVYSYGNIIDYLMGKNMEDTLKNIFNSLLTIGDECNIIKDIENYINDEFDIIIKFNISLEENLKSIKNNLTLLEDDKKLLNELVKNIYKINNKKEKHFNKEIKKEMQKNG